MSGFTLGVLFSDLAVAPICVVPSCGSEVLCPRVALLCVVSFASFPCRLRGFLVVSLSFAGAPCRLLVFLDVCVCSWLGFCVV